MTTNPVRVDFIFDVICPWCFIGKRRLEQAVRMRPTLDVEISWFPFLLNPDMPSQGVDRNDYLIRKFGSEARVRRLFGAIADAGESVSIDFAFERIRRTPNSVNAHRLVRYAHARGRGHEAVEALFINYFLNGKDVGDEDILIDIGAKLGLEQKELTSHLRGVADLDAVYRDNTTAHRLGINGVPSFLFNDAMTISGAQEPKVIARILDVAAAKAD